MELKHEDLRQLSFGDAFAMLPHPSGRGHMICGRAAERRINDLVDRAISRSRYAGRLDHETVVFAIKELIVRRFLREQRELNTRQADRCISAAIKHAAKKLTDLTHLIPCHITPDKSPDHFSIGPVTFRRREKLLSDLEPLLQAYVRQDQQAKEMSGGENQHSEVHSRKMLLDDAYYYYNGFDWIAKVHIDQCAPSVSERRAFRIAQSALDCLHILLSAAHSSRMCIAGPNYKADRRSHIQIDSDGAAKLSGRIAYRGNSLRDGWWESINSQGADQCIRLMGVAIDAGHRLPAAAPLAQRFLDGAAWYGEAVRDEFRAARLIKYVTAMERILVTDDVDDIADTLSKRGASLIIQPRDENLNELRERFKKAYNLRSRLVHGSRSPNEAGLGQGLREAEELARYVLLGSLYFFREDGLMEENISVKQVTENYKRIAEKLEIIAGHR